VTRLKKVGKISVWQDLILKYRGRVDRPLRWSELIRVDRPEYPIQPHLNYELVMIYKVMVKGKGKEDVLSLSLNSNSTLLFLSLCLL